MTASCAATTSARLASIASCQSSKNPSGSSATPSRDNNSYATISTYRWDRVDQLSGTCRSPPRSLNSPEQSDPAQGREPTVPIDELTQLRHPSCGATARAYA